MPLADLAKTTPTADQAVYLDTSAIFSLALQEAVNQGRLKTDPQTAARELSRSKKLIGFLTRSQAAKAQVRTSPLAVEELAARIRNEERKRLATKRGHNNWRDYKRNNPQGAETDDKQGPHATMLAMVECALRPMGQYGVILAQPIIASDVQGAKAIKKTFLELVKTYVQLDPMDAMHILIGWQLNIETFVSFDGGWEVVSKVTVLR